MLRYRIVIILLTVLNQTRCQTGFGGQIGHTIPFARKYFAEGGQINGGDAALSYSLNKGNAYALSFNHQIHPNVQIALLIQKRGGGFATRIWDAANIYDQREIQGFSVRINPTFYFQSNTVNSCRFFSGIGPSVGIINIVNIINQNNLPYRAHYYYKGKSLFGLTTSAGFDFVTLKDKTFHIIVEARYLFSEISINKGNLISWSNPSSTSSPAMTIYTPMKLPFNGVGLFLGLSYDLFK